MTDTLDACETLPNDVLTVIGQFIDVKTMEELIRFNKLNEKLERFKTRTSEEWINIAVNYPLHFDLRDVKNCPKVITVVSYKKPWFVSYCYLAAEEKYKSLYINLINRNLSRFNQKYQ